MPFPPHEHGTSVSRIGRRWPLLLAVSLLASLAAAMMFLFLAVGYSALFKGNAAAAGVATAIALACFFVSTRCIDFTIRMKDAN